KGHVDFQRSEGNPGIKIIDEKSLLRIQPLELKKDAHRNHGGDDNWRTGNETDRSFAHFFLYDRPQKTVDDSPDQRQEDNPTKSVCRYRMIHLTPLSFRPACWQSKPSTIP